MCGDGAFFHADAVWRCVGAQKIPVCLVSSRLRAWVVCFLFFFSRRRLSRSPFIPPKWPCPPAVAPPDPRLYPRATLILQSLATIPLAFEALYRSPLAMLALPLRC